jgi:HEAT repeat protein
MEQTRLAALLERIGEGDHEAQQELLDHIMQQSPGIQALAFQALDEGGDSMVEQLIMTLADDPDLVIRQPRKRHLAQEDADLSELHPIAQQAGREWQEKHPQPHAPQELIEQLRRAERTARVQAARALGEYADPATVGPLVEAIRSGDRLVAAAAVEALQEIGEPAVPELIEVLQATEEQARWHAAKALSTIGDDNAVPSLVCALEDSNYGVRWLAAEALARIGSASLRPLLRRLAEARSSTWLRHGAWHVLNKIDLSDDAARAHYKHLGSEIKRSSAAATPAIARQELRRLGEDA